MDKIIILGKPNVGKSSLFNCFLKERIAITSNTSGTTRDINIKPITINEIEALLCDSAGIIEKITKKEEMIFSNIKQKILSFIDSTDIILYVIDGSSGIDDDDIKLFRKLKNAALIINKIDKKKGELNLWEYGIFGTKDIFFVSSLHNIGLHKVKEFLTTKLKKTESTQDLKQTINIGIIGRVNVGKSSILNALLNKERSIVSDIAGTTIDPVDEKIEYKDKILNFVDTAGIKQRSKNEGIEKYALDRTKKILEKSDIALLVLNSAEKFVDLDEKISGLSDKYNLGIIIVLNKWDIKYDEFEAIKKEIKRKFAYLSYAPIVTASAKNKRHINDIKDMILEVYENYNRRIPTAKLNETIKEATLKHPIPSDKGRIIKIYYATQIKNAPPQIALVMNKPESLHFSYKRYLVNYLRKSFDFRGTPILIIPKAKSSKFNEKIES